MLSIVDAFVTENLEVSKRTDPVLLLSANAGADSKQYTCRIDGLQFTTHAAAVSHMHDVHKNRIEGLLLDMLQGTRCRL